jgi:hypothetical protein
VQQVAENYWVFALVCLLIGLVLVRLLFRERVTLQGSMSFLAFLTLLGLMAIFPGITMRVARALGFTLMSNFLFCTAIAALAILHLRSLVTISKLQLRSISLTQELAIVQERLDRSAKATDDTARVA